MANLRQVFFIGVVGGLVGYACGAAFTPTRAVAQQIGAADAGPATTQPPPDVDGGPPPANPMGVVLQPICRQWEVKAEPEKLIYPTGPSVLIEEGWEPFVYSTSYGTILLRRCVR